MKPEQRDHLQELDKFHLVAATFRRKGAFRCVEAFKSVPSVSNENVQAHMDAFWKAHPPVLYEASAPAEKPDILDEHRHLMMLAARKPGLTSTEYYADLGLSPAAGSRMKKKLEDLWLVKSHQIRTGRRGGSVQAIELLDAGFARIGLSCNERPVKGGFCHRWWAFRIKLRLEDNASNG